MIVTCDIIKLIYSSIVGVIRNVEKYLKEKRIKQQNCVNVIIYKTKVVV